MQIWPLKYARAFIFKKNANKLTGKTFPRKLLGLIVHSFDWRFFGRVYIFTTFILGGLEFQLLFIFFPYDTFWHDNLFFFFFFARQVTSP